MILDKVIIAACCCLVAVCCATPTDQVDGNNKEVPRTARNVFLPPPYYNNAHFYKSPWNYNHYNNYYHPYRHSHYSPSRIPIASASGAINANDYRSPVLYSNDVRHPDGSYFYEFETANGIRRLENSVQTFDDKVVQGSYSHVGPDGRTYTVNYIADKNGYRASGDHLPQQPQPVVAPSLHNYPIVTTPKPFIVGAGGSPKVFHTPAKQPIVAASPFPAYNYHHHAVHPNNVYLSPYQPFSTVRPYLANPYGLGKK